MLIAKNRIKHALQSFQNQLENGVHLFENNLDK